MAGSRIYSNAVAQYMSGRILDGEQLKRLADAAYFDALKMLFDYGYGEGLSIENADIDTLIDAELNALIAFVSDYAGDAVLKRVLTDKYQYVNIKAAYKQKMSAVRAAALFPAFRGAYEAVLSGDYGSLYPETAETLTALDRDAQQAPLTASAIDGALTKCYYAGLTRPVKNPLYHSLRRYLKTEIDYKNIASAFRCRAIGLTPAYLREQLIAGGTLGGEMLEKVLTDLAAFYQDLPADFDEAAAILNGGVGLSAFEREMDRLLYDEAAKNSEDMTGAKPFIHYVVGREIELKTVRMIVTLIKNDARGEIAPRLRRLS
ncbi:MAG: V-type ATPase subunit [Clostridiales bacterium]|jgi:V/A-type H+-transporting ATPase subunit C|nr:V-type ATPase subunit [Clostridiales bacterium]